MTGNESHANICGAKTRSGKPCKNKAMKNGRCRMHGGKTTGPKTKEGKERSKMNALKHGAYVDRILNDQEQIVYDSLHEQTIQTYLLDRENVMHMATLHRACITYIKLMRLDEWEMEESWAPNGELEKDPESGQMIPIESNVYDKDGNIIGKERGRLVRIRWSKNTPSWETHFQKYMQMLGTDRATQIKQQGDDANVQKVADAMSWIWGGKSQENE